MVETFGCAPVQRVSQRVICTAMCVLVGMPMIPVVPAMAVEKASAKKPEATGAKPVESAKAPAVKPVESAKKTDAKPVEGAKKQVETSKKTDGKQAAPDVGGSKAAAIVKEAVSKSSEGVKKPEGGKTAESKKPVESTKMAGTKPVENAKSVKPVESTKKTEAKPAAPEVTGSKAAAVVKEAVSNTQKSNPTDKKEGPASEKSTTKATQSTAKATQSTTKATQSPTKATQSTTKASKSTTKVTESDVPPPVAPAIRSGNTAAGSPAIKGADDAAFARQFVQSKSNSAKPASSTPAAQQNADNQGTRIARPGMPAPTTGANASAGSLDNQGSRIARPGMPIGGSGAQGTANGAPNAANGQAANSAKTNGAGTANGAVPTKVSDTPPPVAPPVTTGGTANQVPKAPNANVQDDYPAVGSLEQVTFGTTNPGTPIEKRISTLESAIFAKTYETESLFDRTERLKRTLMGQSEDAGGGAPAYGAPGGPGYGAPGGPAYGGTAGGAPVMPPGAPNYGNDPSQQLSTDAQANMQALADLAYLEEFADKPENRKQEPSNVIEGFAAEIVNFERQKRGLPPLENDETLTKMAKAHVSDLHKTSALSHTDSRGNNPDRRFTVLGGVDAVNEGLAAIDSADLGTSRPTKAAVAKSMKRMMMRTDDRDTLMSPDASHMGFAMGPNSDGTRVLSCTEIETRRAVIQPLPHTVRLGEKVEVQGILMKPYQFDKITIAWEGKSEDGAVQNYEQVDEALPYFPPLDYVAYKDHSEKDYTKAISTLKTLGMIAAIAGGMFMPPVALAAPLIVMAGPNPEPKPQSDIPVKGSVHVDGQSFDVRIPLSNDSKEGLYYITVWANQGEGTRPVPVSRRTLHVTADETRLAKANTKEVVEEDATGEVEPAKNNASNNPNPFLDTPLSQLKAEPKSLSDLPPDSSTGTPKPTDSQTGALAAPAAAKLSDAPALPPTPAQAPPAVQGAPPSQAAPPAVQGAPPSQAAPPAVQAAPPSQAAPPAVQAAPPSQAAPVQAATQPAAQGTSNSQRPASDAQLAPSMGGLRPAIAQPKTAQPKAGAGQPNGAPNSGSTTAPNNANKSELKSDVPEQPTIQ